MATWLSLVDSIPLRAASGNGLSCGEGPATATASLALHRRHYAGAVKAPIHGLGQLGACPGHLEPWQSWRFAPQLLSKPSFKVLRRISDHMIGMVYVIYSPFPINYILRPKLQLRRTLVAIDNLEAALLEPEKHTSNRADVLPVAHPLL